MLGHRTWQEGRAGDVSKTIANGRKSACQTFLNAGVVVGNAKGDVGLGLSGSISSTMVHATERAQRERLL